jgi:dephospho-CoA kinase
LLVVGLTGGIGAGKSTLAALLAERGAQVIDADDIGRDALRPGRPAWHSVVDQFGEEILVANGLDIDRKRLARVVFADPRKLAALNAIVHPVIFAGVAEHLEKLRYTDDVVVLDAALILDTGLDEAAEVIIVVTSSAAERRRRLVEGRGLTFEDVRARMAAQMDPAEMVERADIVVRNDGSIGDLAAEAERVWKELQGRISA